MDRLRLFTLASFALGLAWGASTPALANILIQVDKSSQTMT
jgi:hypothetical protein